MTADTDREIAMTGAAPERGPIEHELKTWQSYFHAIADGTKTFELRRDDRDFRVGDTLRLRETEYGSGNYTGREERRLITQILRREDDLGLKDGFAILSLARLRATSVPDDEIAGIRERRAKITPGEWLNHGPMAGQYGPSYEIRTRDTEPENKHFWPFRICESITGQTAAVDQANFDFIAHAPADIDTLLSALAALKARIGELEMANIVLEGLLKGREAQNGALEKQLDWYAREAETKDIGE